MKLSFSELVNQLYDLDIHYYTKGANKKENATTFVVRKFFLSKEKAEFLISAGFRNSSKYYYKTMSWE